MAALQNAARLEAASHSIEGIAYLVEVMRNKAEDTPYRLKAVTELLNRGLGTPQMQVDIDIVLRRKISEMSLDELRQLEERLAGSLAQAASPLLLEGQVESNRRKELMDSLERPLLELVRSRRAELERDEGEASRQILIAFESMRSDEIEAVLLKILEECCAGQAPSAVLQGVVQALQIGDREEVGTPSEFDNMSADERTAALVKVLAARGIVAGDADEDKPQQSRSS